MWGKNPIGGWKSISLAERLPSMYEVLGSFPSIEEKKKILQVATDSNTGKQFLPKV